MKPLVIKVNLVTLVKWVKKYLKWKRKKLVNGKEDV